MLQYKNKLLEASFRGVTFGVKSISMTFGRRALLHEYPLRDEPYAEDLGRKAREFTIDAFVMSPNDFTASRSLRSVLEDFETAGTFVHPTVGPMQVTPRDCTHNYSTQEGGIEYFTVSFVETLGNNFPNTVVDTQSLIRTSVANLLNTSNNYFSSNFKTTSLPDFIGNAAIRNVSAFATKFNGLVNFGSARNGDPNDYSRLIDRLNKFIAQIPELVSDPVALAKAINDLNSDLNDSFSGNLDLAMLIQSRLFEYGDDFLVVLPTTDLRQIELDNQNQIIYLIKASALAMMIRNVALTTFASSDDALATRDAIDVKAWGLLEVLGDNFDDDIYTALKDANTAMIQDVRVRSADLSTVRSYKIADPLPALVLSYEFTGDATKDQELIDRNNIANPLFVPAYSTVKVVD